MNNDDELFLSDDAWTPSLDLNGEDSEDKEEDLDLDDCMSWQESPMKFRDFKIL